MFKACRNLGVEHTLVQQRDVALSTVLHSTSNSMTITSKKYCLSPTCRNLCARQSCRKGRNAALSMEFIPHAIALPSLQRSTVCLPPAETVANKNWAYANVQDPRGKNGLNHGNPLSDQLAWGAPITMVKCIQYSNNPHCTPNSVSFVSERHRSKTTRLWRQTVFEHRKHT